jgi:crossover junction endodeoxyribonuclease RusA
MIESAKDLGPWRERIALAAHNAVHGRKPLTGAITLELVFVMPRPVSAPKTKTPPAIKRPDLDKLARSCLDALTGIAFHDDSQVTHLTASKRLAEIGETPGVQICAIQENP